MAHCSFPIINFFLLENFKISKGLCLLNIFLLIQMDPLPALEESLVSIVVAVARHSPTCADAVMKCPNLIQTVVKIFTKQGVERYPSQIKAVLLLKVRSWLDWNDMFPLDDIFFWISNSAWSYEQYVNYKTLHVYY